MLKFVDMFTVATCTPPALDSKPASGFTGSPITAPFSCVAESEKHRCIDGGGTCAISRDGYYYINVMCIIIGVVTFWGFIKPAVFKLQTLPVRAWRLNS